MADRAKLKVTAPAQGDVEVTVYRANGSTAALAYTTETGSSLVSWALTVDAGETATVWVPVGAYVVSVKTTDDVEFAGGYGATRAVFVDNDGVDLRPEPPVGSYGGSGGGGGTGDLLAANNLDDVDDAAEALSNLGGVAATAISTNGKGYVNHGSTASTARPTGFASIEWHGSVEPTNAIDGDTWVDTSA